MTKFVSEIKIISHSQLQVYAVLSDLTNLERIQDQVPTDKMKDFTFDRDSFFFSIHTFGRVKITIVERILPKTIKFSVEQMSVKANLWIQLVSTAERETKMKLTVQADLNPFLKPILFVPLREGVYKVADILTKIPYHEIVAKKY